MTIKPVQRSFSRPFGQPQRNRFKVVADFRRRNCIPARNHLYDDATRATRLSEGKYQALLKVLETAGHGQSMKVRVFLPLRALETVAFESIPLEEFKTYVRVHTLDLRQVKQITARYWERTRRLPQPVALLPPATSPKADLEAGRTSTALVPRARDLLTDDLLFNPNSGLAYPRNPGEYHELMARLLDKDGLFPGDTEGLTRGGTFSPKTGGVSHRSLRRRGVKFQVEILSPRLHAQAVMNRLIFDADLISQAASNDTYGTPGVSYDRESYYVRRLFDAEKVPFIRLNGWPVSFAAMQGYEMSFQGKDIYYAFIHFVMTQGPFQGHGLTSYAVREGMSSLFYSNVWQNRSNLMFDQRGNLKDYRFRMWAAAHSGRFAPFYAFAKGLGQIASSGDLIAQTIFRDVHSRITAPSEIANRGLPVSLGARPVNGGIFSLALDQEVYPPHTRYPVINRTVDFPQREVNLPSSIRSAWLDAIGGEQGVAEGNGIYFGGLITFGKIREAKRRESRREGGAMQVAGDRVRGYLVSRSK